MTIRSSSAVFLTCMAILGSANPLASQEPNEPPKSLSFYETFDKPIDLGRWYLSDGWAGSDMADCMLSGRNVRIENGALEIALRKEKNPIRPYTCADVQSRQLLGYGTFEARMRAAIAPGTVSTFFTYAQDVRDEIDFEVLGRYAKKVQLNYFTAGQGGHEYLADLDFSVDTMNDYAFEWLPDSIRWFINGKLVHEVRREAGKPFPTHPQKIYLALWNGRGTNAEQWLEPFVYSEPLTAAFDYVAYTQMGEPCHFAESIACMPGANGRTDQPR
jgi:endo-1,3-1,4-beta-glycanase ExoK